MPFFWCLTSKNVVTLKSGSEVTQGYWKCNVRYIAYDFILVFYRNLVPLSPFWDIWLQKCHDLDNWLEISPCDRVHTTSYWRSIVTMALSCVISEIFIVEKCCDLEIGVRGHSRSLKVVPFDRLCMVCY